VPVRFRQRSPCNGGLHLFSLIFEKRRRNLRPGSTGKEGIGFAIASPPTRLGNYAQMIIGKPYAGNRTHGLKDDK